MLTQLSKIWKFGVSQTIIRWKRLFRHLAVLFHWKSLIPASDFFDWPIDLLFYLGDLVYLPEIHMSIILIIKPSIRPLTDNEKILVEEWFEDTIDPNAVLINDHASVFVRKYAYAFVGYNIINYRDRIETAILVHELVHVFQFQKFGSVYIYRALKAQNSKHKYDYGGVTRLVNGLNQGKSLFHYNFEQQAMIIEDYYRMNHEFQMFSDRYSREVFHTYYNDLKSLA